MDSSEEDLGRQNAAIVCILTMGDDEKCEHNSQRRDNHSQPRPIEVLLSH